MFSKERFLRGFLFVCMIFSIASSGFAEQNDVSRETKSVFDPYFSSRFETGFSGGGTKSLEDGFVRFESSLNLPALKVTAAEGPSVDGVPFRLYSALDTTFYYNSADCGNVIGNCSNYAATGFVCESGQWMVDLAEPCGGLSNSDEPAPGDAHIFCFEQEEFSDTIEHKGYYGVTNLYVDLTSGTVPQEAQTAEFIVEQRAIPVPGGFSGVKFDLLGNPSSTPEKCALIKWHPAYEALDTTCPDGVTCTAISGTNFDNRLISAYCIYRSFDGINYDPTPIGTVLNNYVESNEWLTFRDCSVPVGQEVYYSIGLTYYLDPLVAGNQMPLETSVISANSNRIVVPNVTVTHNGEQSQTILAWEDVTAGPGILPSFYEIWGSNGPNIADATEATLISTVPGGIGPYSEAIWDEEVCQNGGTCNYYRVIAIFW